MHRFLLSLVFSAATAAAHNPSFNSPFGDDFEDRKGMADTGWLTPNKLTSTTVGAGDQVINTVFIADLNDGLVRNVFNGSSTGVYSLFPSQTCQLVVDFTAPLSIPSGTLVTGIEISLGAATRALAVNGTPLLGQPTGIIDTEVSFVSLGVPTTGNIAAGVQLNLVGETIYEGYEERFWGGAGDEWGSPSIASDPAFYDSDFHIQIVLENTGIYAAEIWLDYIAIRVHYTPTTSVLMAGTGSTAAAAQRGIKITSALAGAGVSSTAANAVFQDRKITAALAGAGEANASIRLDDGGTIYVYGESHLRGKGASDIPTVNRLIPIPGHFVGGGVASATVQRGKPFKAWNKFFVGDPSIGFPGAMIARGAAVASIFNLKKITAALAGTGAVTMATGGLQRIIKITSALVGTGATSASVFVHRTITAAMAGLGSASASVLRAKPIAAALAGMGSASATVQRLIKITAAMAGLGSVQAEAFSGTESQAPEERRFKVPVHGEAFIVPAIDNKFKV